MHGVFETFLLASILFISFKQLMSLTLVVKCVRLLPQVFKMYNDISLSGQSGVVQYIYVFVDVFLSEIGSLLL